MELTIKDIKENLLNDLKNLNNKSDYSFICKNSFMILRDKKIVRFEIIKLLYYLRYNVYFN